MPVDSLDPRHAKLAAKDHVWVICAPLPFHRLLPSGMRRLYRKKCPKSSGVSIPCSRRACALIWRRLSAPLPCIIPAGTAVGVDAVGQEKKQPDPLRDHGDVRRLLHVGVLPGNGLVPTEQPFADLPASLGADIPYMLGDSRPSTVIEVFGENGTSVASPDFTASPQTGRRPFRHHFSLCNYLYTTCALAWPVYPGKRS